MRKRLVAAAAVLAAVCALMLTACGGSARSKSASDMGRMESAPAAAPAVAADGAVYKGSSGSAPAVAQGRKLIRTIGISVRLPDETGLQDAVSGLYRAAEAQGGLVVSNSMNYEESYAGGSLRIQVPKDRVDAFLDDVKGTGLKITGINDSSRDVTSEYVDTEARIRVLEQKIENYQRYLEQAENVTETLEISDRLDDAIADLEAYKATIKSLDQQIEYTVVDVSISCEESSVKPSAGERFRRALGSIGEDFADALLDGLRWFTEAVAFLVFLLPIIWVVIRVIASAVRWKRKDKGAKKEKAAKKDRSGGNGINAAEAVPAAPASGESAGKAGDPEGTGRS